MEDRLIPVAGLALPPPRPSDGHHLRAASAGHAVAAAAGWSDLTAAVRGAERHRSDEAVSLEEFMLQLHREKRRCERSQRPLSLVLFRLAEDGDADHESREQLLGAVCGVKRETDIVGRAPGGLVAVLCPDTDENGTRSLLRKVSRHAGDLPFVMSVATYPDDLFDSLAQGVATSSVFEPFIATEEVSCPRASYPLKRTLDVVGALFALALFAPVMLAVALAVSLSSRGPVIFKQKRVGRDGVPFTFYKFRSMVPNGNDGIHREFVAALIQKAAVGAPAANDDSALYKIKADPRVTPVGRFLRRTSLDELPQLFNVLKGDMSLVGPRPERQHFIDAIMEVAPHYRHLHKVRPGITSWGQVKFGYAENVEQMVRRLKYDILYIENMSLAVDLKILAYTVLIILRGDGK